MPAPTRSFEALGTRWTFAFGFHAICTLEEQYNEPFVLCLLRYFPTLEQGQVLNEEALLQARFTARMTDLRALLIAGLSQHHPDITAATVSQIVDDYGVDKIGELVKHTVAGGTGGSEGTANPPI